MPDPAPTNFPRRTLAAPARLRGITLFTGVTSTLTINPAPQNHPGGFTIRRADLPGSPAIPMNLAHLIPEARHTVLAIQPGNSKTPQVHTTEHILSALVGSGITDAALELEGPEIPIADGSALPFVETITAAGVHPIDAAAADQPIRISREITIRHPSMVGEITASPATNGSSALELEYRLDYGDGSPIGSQSASMRVMWGEPNQTYRSEIAPARTFCLLEEAQAMRKMGLFAHLEPRDMLVIGPDGQPIDNQWRFPDEPARHKLLDLLGDLALAGRPIIGKVSAVRSGHGLNHELVRALLSG